MADTGADTGTATGEDTGSDAAVARYGTRRPRSVLASIAITLLILGFGFAVFGFSPALFLSLYGGMAASYIAVPYTVFAIVAREVRARRGRARDRVEAGAGVESAYRSDALGFTLFRQRASLVTAVVMLAVLIVAAVASAIRAWGEPSGYVSDPTMSLSTFGAFAFVGGVFAIVVNVPSIYSEPVVSAERHAMRARVGAWRMILATTILTTVSWIAYCGFALYFLTSMWL